MTEPARLSSAFLVSALMRRVANEGGFATILQRGNDGAGAIIIDCRERGVSNGILEKFTNFDGDQMWRPVDSPNAATAKWADEYGARRAAGDPDLWWIELDIAGAARFADEMIRNR